MSDQLSFDGDFLLFSPLNAGSGGFTGTKKAGLP